ncbi:MAG: M1 family metallopeptidase [Planctomycetota bacterium]|nr:M1 family metallopeptidase [Planctomycetota bacterium]
MPRGLLELLRLDGETKELQGQARIRWENRSGETVSDLWFHLYLNAFSNNRSTHMVEAKGKLRDHEMEEGWGWSRVTSMRVGDAANGGDVDVMPTFRYRRPDDDNEEDRTVFSIDLPQPAEPGDVVEIQLEWESQLPRVRRRTGFKDDFLLVAQWFPKLGVYEAGRGWNCHQFHMNSEFYADYGTYEVKLDLPLRYEGKVFGSGRKEFDTITEGRYLVRFVAPSSNDQRRTDRTGKQPLVHDFTWTADPDYEVRPYTFRFDEWAEKYPEEIEKARRAFGADKDITLRDVDVTVLIHSEREGQAHRHFRATSTALFFYGLWFGEYPYEHVTVIDPAWGGGGAGGMEYPTLFTCGTKLFTTEDMYRPESVTVHEAGHQFWYGLVGNNEFEAAWLDEGFNSYTDSEALLREYGPSRSVTWYADLPVDGVPVAALSGGGKLAEALTLRRIPMPFGMPLKPVRPSGFLDRWRDQPRLTFVQEWSDPRWGDRTGYLRDPDSDPIDTAAWEYVDRGSYRTNSYPRTAVALRTLKNLVGGEAFLRGMRHYAETWRYGHPYGDDFFQSFQEGAGVDVGWYFDDVFRGTETADWSVEVTQQRRLDRQGFFQGEGGEFIERERPEEEERADDDRPWQVEVIVRRSGELSLPVPLRLRFEDGTVRDEIWSRDEQLVQAWRKIVIESDHKLVSAVLDPSRGNYLDVDLSNNQWFEEPDDLTPLRWGERVLAQMQHYLHWIGGIGG